MLIDKKKENRQKQRKRAQEYLRAVAMFHGCQICTERDYACLDFHHLNPKEKEGDVHYMVRNKWSQPKIIGELVKCSCICSNCHRKLHAGTLITKKNLTALDKNVLLSLDTLIKALGFETFKKSFMGR